MPHVINGIGTWYYGKRNITTRRATCDSCGRVGDLQSYDTTLFFVVLFVPIIPLGGKRVLNSCPSCRRHRVTALREWEEQKAKAIGDAVLEFRNQSSSPEAAIRAVSATVTFEAQQEFLGLTSMFTPALARDADFVACVGDAYTHFGMRDEARGAYEAALKLRDDPDIARALAVNLLKADRVDDALRVVGRLLARKEPRHAGVLYLTAEGLQAQGRHEEALALLEKHGSELGVETEAEYLKYHALSTKHRASGKVIKSAHLKLGKVKQSDGSWRFTLARLIPLLVLVGALGTYFGVAITRGWARPVFLISGLPEDSTVKVNGDVYPLSPNIERRITVAEGDLEVSVLTPAGRVATQTVSIRTNFWTRPFVSHVFVLNPDQLSILAWEQTYYASNPSQIPPGKTVFHAGRVLHEFTGVDYAFQPFPSSITMSSKSGTKSKTRVTTAPRLETRVLLAALRSRLGDDTVRELCKLGMREAPGEEAYSDIIRLVSEPGEILEFLKPMLAERPVRLRAHRLYQDLTEIVRPEHDLRAEYRALLDGAPGDAACSYLLGRVTDDPEEARKLYRAAIAADATMELPRRALSYSYQGEARFAESERSCAEALAAFPGNTGLEELQVENLLAQEKYAEVLELTRFKQPAAHPGSDPELKLILLSLLKRENEAQAVLSEMVALEDPSEQAQRRDWLLAQVACAKGDGDAAAKLLASSNEPIPRFWKYLLEGDIGQAEKMLGGALNDFPGPTCALWACMGAIAAGDNAARDRILPLIVSSMRSAVSWGSAPARMLESHTPPDVGEFSRLSASMDDRGMLLLIFADLYPARAGEYRAMAAKFMHDPRFPNILMKRAMERGKKR